MGNDQMGLTLAALQQTYPAWDLWEGMLGGYHARVKGAVPPVMVDGEDLVDLRDQINAKIGRADAWWGRNSIA